MSRPNACRERDVSTLERRDDASCATVGDNRHLWVGVRLDDDILVVGNVADSASGDRPHLNLQLNSATNHTSGANERGSTQAYHAEHEQNQTSGRQSEMPSTEPPPPPGRNVLQVHADCRQREAVPGRC